MNILNLNKFKKKIGQNYLIYNLKKFFDLCSGFNYFNKLMNDIDYFKNKFIKNKNYLSKKKCFYNNFLLFNFFLNKIININISFNIIYIFLKKILFLHIFFFKIIISNYFIFFIKKICKIFKIKKFFKKNFFPYVKIKISKIYIKKNNFLKNYKNFYYLKLKIKFKLEKLKVYINKIIFLKKNNVIFIKI